MSAVVPAQTFPANLTLQTRYRRLAVVVDVGCAEGVMFVAQVSYCFRAASNVIDSSHNVMAHGEAGRGSGGEIGEWSG
jgi:hypothetical protein